jgi:NAD(P)-dependent dehydrogenase (short-subunit alcohol dehydrogenase family)
MWSAVRWSSMVVSVSLAFDRRLTTHCSNTMADTARSHERDPSSIWTPPESLGRAPSRQRLTGRRILVVGAGSQPCDDVDAPIGNGRAIAVLCAREGGKVICADRDQTAAAQTAARIGEEGGAAAVVTADVAQEADCERVVTESQAAFGGLDAVVLNVGIGLGRGLANTETRQWDKVFAVNLRAHFLIAKFALPRLPCGGGLLFISSTASLRPGTSVPAYDASKAGLAGLCRHVAFEGAARGVRANVIAPGLMDTPLGRVASRGRPSRARTHVPLGRQGTGWEVGYTALFLLSDEACYITGQVIVVDGGLSALR